MELDFYTVKNCQLESIPQNYFGKVLFRYNKFSNQLKLTVDPYMLEKFKNWSEKMFFIRWSSIHIFIDFVACLATVYNSSKEIDLQIYLRVVPVA